MSRTLALFAFSSQQHVDLLLREPNLLIGHPKASEILESLDYIAVGETIEALGGDRPSVSMQAVMNFLAIPKVITSTVAEQIVDDLFPAQQNGENVQEPIGIVNDAQTVFSFLNAQIGKQLSYFWLD